jgi:hypothetical protein
MEEELRKVVDRFREQAKEVAD